MACDAFARRVAAADWAAVGAELDEAGVALLPRLLTPTECARIAALDEQPDRFPQGHGLVFTTRDRPVRSARGWSAAPRRHGVSTVRSGRRLRLGLVFHDAT